MGERESEREKSLRLPRFLRVVVWMLLLLFGIICAVLSENLLGDGNGIAFANAALVNDI